jgi:hypothetical protein
MPYFAEVTTPETATCENEDVCGGSVKFVSTKVLTRSIISPPVILTTDSASLVDGCTYPTMQKHCCKESTVSPALFAVGPTQCNLKCMRYQLDDALALEFSDALFDFTPCCAMVEQRWQHS